MKEDIIQGSVDAAFNNICAAVLKCATQAIPRGCVKRHSPFWNEELQRLKEERNAARNVYEQSRLPEDGIRLKRAGALLRKEIINAKRNSYNQFLENLDCRKDGVQAHRFLSKISKNTEPVKREPFVTSSGKTLTSNEDIAKLFCSYFSKISSWQSGQRNRKLDLNAPPTCLNEREDLLFRAPFCRAELEIALDKMPIKKCAGPDNIPSEFIKHLGGSARNTLLQFMNKVWEQGAIPSAWRKADILPIPKKGKPANKPENCRPIALTSMFSKLYERLLLPRLQEFLEDHQLISDKQAGFRKHRNTVEQVAYLSQEIKNGFHRGQSTVAVFVDLKAAFDKVWRERLIQKIRDVGVAGNMFKSISSFLAQRYIRVKYNGSVSPFKQTRKGVPQGAVLSPTLFSLMINDVVAALEANPGVRALLYADDLVIWSTSSYVDAIESCINQALETLYQWTTKNKLEVNTSKTEYQVFTLSTRRKEVRIKFNNEMLPQTDSATYLGIKMDGKLGWKKHIDKLVQQGEGRLGLLKRLAGIKWGANQDLMALTYKSYIRPIIEYGNEVLLTASDNSLKALDLLQNKALRLITGAAKSTPIAAMEIQAGVEPLQLRREISAINLFERVKRLKIKHWDLQESSAQRLKTQKPLAIKVDEVVASRGLDLGKRQPFGRSTMLHGHLAEARLNLAQPLLKDETPEQEMKALALETIHSRYPARDWLHIYTDGSARAATHNAGAGVYCKEFTLAVPVGRMSTNFDGEVKAISMALAKIIEDKKDNPQIVLFIDSQAAISAIASRHHTDHLEVEIAKSHVAVLIERGTRVVLQWVPSHCGLAGNEQADELARRGAEMQQPDTPLAFSAVKKVIKTSYKEELQKLQQHRAEGKQWRTLLENPVSKTATRKEAVACFRMTTGHDYLQKHLHRIGVVDSPMCPLCLQEEEMDSRHLQACHALTDVSNDTTNLNDDKVIMAKLYWAARSRMA